MASEPKNYNSCPLKKRPFLFVDPVKEEPEQEEPVNLCIRKVNSKDDAAAAASMQKSTRTQPLKDITAHNHQHQQQDRIRHAPYRIDESRVPYVKQELYNLLPGYAANTTNTLNYTQRTSLPSPPMLLPPQSASSIKSEPEYWHSSYSREPSMSPPSSTRISYVASPPSPPMKILSTSATVAVANNSRTSAPASNIHSVSRDQFYQSENVMKSHQYVNKPSHRYAAYISRQHHIVDEYHSNSSHMSPTHSHSSLNSLGGSASSRSSMSPASTSSSIEDQYNMMHLSNIHTSNGSTLTKPMTYSETGTGRVEHSVIIKSDTPRYKCAACSKSYSTHSGLTKHMQFHCTASPNNQAPKSFKCQYCEKTYTSLGALKMHIRTHTKPCKCHLCGKAFSRPWLLQGHIRTHTGDKPFSCTHCHRAFADKSNLRAHLQTHSDVKKYPCHTCTKTFSRMSLLTKHSETGCPGLHEHQSHH